MVFNSFTHHSIAQRLLFHENLLFSDKIFLLFAISLFDFKSTAKLNWQFTDENGIVMLMIIIQKNWDSILKTDL